MSPRISFAAAVGAFFCLSVGTFSAQDKPKFTIAEVMDMAHKGTPALCKKMVDGEASKEEQSKLLEYYTALTKCKPPKGEQKSWDAKTKALVDSVSGALKGDKDAIDKYKTAVDCKSCHSVHRVKK